MVGEEINSQQEEPQEVEPSITRKRVKHRTLKIFAVIIIVIILVILVLVSYYTDFSIWFIIGIGGAVIFIGLIMFFGASIIKKVREIREGKEVEGIGGLPRARPLEELYILVEKTLKTPQYREHVEKWHNAVPSTVGNNTIYDFEIKPLYYDGICHIIINAHYPDKRAILFDPPPPVIKNTINKLSTVPLDEPDIERSELWNPITQTWQSIEKKTRRGRPPKKEQPRGELE